MSEYTISYTGMDGLEHTENHIGDQASADRLVTFLEERGAQLITVEQTA